MLGWRVKIIQVAQFVNKGEDGSELCSTTQRVQRDRRFFCLSVKTEHYLCHSPLLDVFFGVRRVRFTGKGRGYLQIGRLE